MHKFINNSSTSPPYIYRSYKSSFVFLFFQFSVFPWDYPRWSSRGKSTFPLGIPSSSSVNRRHLAAAKAMVTDQWDGFRTETASSTNNCFTEVSAKKDTGAFYSIHSRMPCTIPTLRRYTYMMTVTTCTRNIIICIVHYLPFWALISSSISPASAPHTFPSIHHPFNKSHSKQPSLTIYHAQ